MPRPATGQGWVTDRADGAVVSVLVAPKSGTNKIGAVEGSELKVYVTAPPADGTANAAVVKLLSQYFRVPMTRIEVISGHSSRHKRLLIRGISAVDLNGRSKAP
jgi:uncharacterized protein (TIGR00251 family)